MRKLLLTFMLVIFLTHPAFAIEPYEYELSEIREWKDGKGNITGIEYSIEFRTGRRRKVGETYTDIEEIRFDETGKISFLALRDITPRELEAIAKAIREVLREQQGR
jgi:hypothetical protein